MNTHSIDKHEADGIAQRYIHNLTEMIGTALKYSLYFDGEIGWLYFFGAIDPNVHLAGNGPFLVMKDGGIVRFPTAYHPIKESLPEIQEKGTLNGEPLNIDYSYIDEIRKGQM